MKLGKSLETLIPVALVAVGVMMSLVACSSDGTSSSVASASSAAASTSPSMAVGKRLYYGRCTSCHSPEPVDNYTRAEWTDMVAHMRKRAKLTPDEEASLLIFLHANALADL